MVAVSDISLQSYEKTSEMKRKARFSFHIRAQCNFGEAKVTKKSTKKHKK